MRRPVVDYSGFRISKLRDPRFYHLLLLLGWLVYFAGYFLTENLIPAERCHLIHSGLDDVIPFVPGFLVFYVSWYALTAGSLLYYLLYDVERFRQLQIFIMITQAAAMVIYVLYPSRQDLRPDTFTHPGILTWILGMIYAFDTPTGVFPSLHVAFSIGIASVWRKDKNAPRPWRAFVVLMAVLISLSTTMIKQHSVLDIFAALPVALLAEAVVFGKSYWLPRWRRRRK